MSDQPIFDTSVIAVISVVVTGLVSISSPVLAYFTDRSRSKREAEARRVEGIERAASDLLEAIAYFEGIRANTADGFDLQNHFTVLRTKLYTWDVTVSSHLPEKERNKINNLWEQLGQYNPSGLAKMGASCANEVLRLSEIAMKGKK